MFGVSKLKILMGCDRNKGVLEMYYVNRYFRE